MSSSSFKNTLRRFQALRGPVKVFRSDKGTSFVEVADELDLQTLNVKDGPIKKYIRKMKQFGYVICGTCFRFMIHELISFLY